jgi:hypothetical protein
MHPSQLMEASMSGPTATTDAVPDALRQLAEKLDAFVEPDLRAITGWTEKTIVTYRKRGLIVGIKIGKHYVYLRKPILDRAAERTPRRVPAKGLL